jgi:hypothetical protein
MAMTADADQDLRRKREAIEAIIRAGIRYGHSFGRAGYDLPEVEFEWDDQNRPRIKLRRSSAGRVSRSLRSLRRGDRS